MPHDNSAVQQLVWHEPFGTAESFNPRRALRSPFLQSVLATQVSRRRHWLQRGSRMAELASLRLLDGGDGVRLAGWLSPQPAPRLKRGFVTLIHGWEGSHESAYLYSMACALHAAGYAVLRLNLRDHGNSFHLNEDLFHSGRLDEVLNAIRDARRLDGDHSPLYVVGFSLGGNFALRVGLHGPAVGLHPRLSIGISPAIDPGSAMTAIDAGPSVFRQHFLGRWHKSVRAKAVAWPQREDFRSLAPSRSIVESTHRFVAAHTDFSSYEEYLAAYTLTPAVLSRAPTPLAIITAQDDPIIPFEDFAGLRVEGSLVAYDTPAWGGHCGFIENWSLESWAEKRVLALIAQAAAEQTAN